MPLIQKQGAAAPKELGLFWPMRSLEGAEVHVFIYVSALQSFDPDPLGPVGLLKRHRPLLERIASEKYDRDGVSGPALLQLTLDDLNTAQAAGAITAAEGQENLLSEDVTSVTT